MEFKSTDAQMEVDDKISSASVPLPPAQFTRRGGRMLSELFPARIGKGHYPDMD